ncbi:MAG TPA: hypothetical protein P5119_07435 [Candidatus Aminicenantes bacterium]|nr:hypothetical protein [Candidatus Aminicenantes bacterium]HRY65160.1 hypothetical protein [Candidatus Aminicenantes bacterium]HRZ72372.1 hypothetical protein [Candidatus Aminicenantes bacterium]
MSAQIGESQAPASLSGPARSLPAILTAFVFLQAAGGLFIRGLYRDNAWVVSIYRGTDWVTLLLVVPLLLGALFLARRGAPRALPFLAGLAYYVFYNNVYYLFTAFNRFFLVYAAVFVLSAATVVAVLLAIHPGRIGAPGPDPARKPVGLAMLAMAAILAVMWIGQSLLFVANGKVPQLILDTGGTTHMVAALDLTLIVPPLTLGAVWLWKGRPWGRVLALAMNVQCSIIALVLVVSTPFQAAAGVKDAWTFFPLWAFMGVVFWISAAVMLKNGRRRPDLS